MTDRFSHRRRHLFFERKLILTVFVFCFWVAPVQGGSWTPLGPTGSYVRVVRIDPTNPNTVYAGLVFNDGHQVGGVFKSPDGGMTWNDANNGLPPNSGIYALTIDPTNPSTLYVGIDNYGWQGGGMYKSTDGGASWTQLSYHPEWGVPLDCREPEQPRHCFCRYG